MTNVELFMPIHLLLKCLRHNGLEYFLCLDLLKPNHRKNRKKSQYLNFYHQEEDIRYVKCHYRIKYDPCPWQQ